VLRQLLQEQDMLAAELELVRERLGLTRGRLEAANAANLVGQLEWEEDRRPDRRRTLHPEDPTRSLRPSLLSTSLSKGWDALPRGSVMSPGSRERVRERPLDRGK